MKIKQGDIIQDDYYKDVWRVLTTHLSNGGWLRAECIDVGIGISGLKNTYHKGQHREFPYDYSGWRVLPRKSLNFNSLYEKLQGRG